jgi:hypothetical protein
VAAARAILAARTAALRTGRLAAWLALVDPRNPAEQARQRTLFANLRQLPLVSYTWTFGEANTESGYGLSASTTDPGVTATYVPEVDVSYQLRGFDPAPVRSSWYPVLVQRGGRWYLGGDRTSVVAGDQRVEPWETGPVKVAVGRQALVVVSATDAKRLPALAAQADQATSRVVGLWRTGWDRKVVLYDVRGSTVFASFLGDLSTADSVSAVTVNVGGSRPDGGDDTRVVANPRFAAPGAQRLVALLAHEFTHVATWDSQNAGTPRWAIEGIAEYTAFRGHVGEQRVTKAIGRDARAHRLPTTLPADAPFYGTDDAAASYAYGIAWLTWEYVGEKYGDAKVRALWAALAAMTAERGSAAAARAEAAAFASVLRTSESALVRKLDAWVALVVPPAA